MKNFRNIRKFSYALLIAAMASMTFTSCLVDDESLSDKLDDGPNLVGFDKNSESANYSATGDDMTYYAKLTVVGPNVEDMNKDVTVTVKVNEKASTAVEGVHYRPLSNNTITLTAEQDYLATMPVQIITAGIVPPLDESPILVLEITNLKAGSNVVLNGRTQQVTVKINYLCYSDLAGTYTIEYSGGPLPHVVTKIGEGIYECSAFPGWPNDPSTAFTFKDICGQVTMLEWGYSNVITGTGHVEASTGNIVWEAVTVAGVSGYENLSWVMVKQ